jgi:dTDP-4-dehydrorhamnose 3,5-epimerase
VLRGLHYHRHQADAWYLVAGAARVGLADLRASLEHPPALTLDLDATSPAVLYIPPGVAHGYLALANVDLIYWTTEYYDGADEHSIAWNDATLAVPWRATDPVLSARDRAAPLFDRNAVAVALGRP